MTEHGVLGKPPKKAAKKGDRGVLGCCEAGGEDVGAGDSDEFVHGCERRRVRRFSLSWPGRKWISGITEKLSTMSVALPVGSRAEFQARGIAVSGGEERSAY